jgi:phage terminase small subunit
MSRSKSSTNAIEPPEHLSDVAKIWWKEFTDVFDFSQPNHQQSLRLAFEALDRARWAVESIEANGMVYIDRWGQPKARPEVAIARDNTVLFCRVLREMGLDVQPSDPRLPRPAGRY